MRWEDIASRLEAIEIRLEAIAISIPNFETDRPSGFLQTNQPPTAMCTVCHRVKEKPRQP